MNNVNAQASSLTSHEQPRMYSKERFFNAILFEALALLLTIPLSKFITEKDTDDVAMVGIFMSIYCVFWNYVYNFLFDKACRNNRESRSVIIRIIHSVGFETSLIVATVPFIAFMLDILLTDALQLEAGLLVFFFIYTFMFNWTYDKFVHRVVNKLLMHSI